MRMGGCIMERFVEVELNGKKEKFREGMTYREIIESLGFENPRDFVLVKKDGRLRELYKELKTPGKMELIKLDSEDGMRVYRRTMLFVMQKVLDDMGREKPMRLSVLHSVSNGYFCRLKGRKIDDALLEKLGAGMRDVIERDLKIEKYELNTRKASEKFGVRGYDQKKKLLKYRTSSRVNIYRLEDYEDYFFGFMLPSTGYLRSFELRLFEDGFVLIFPDKDYSAVIKFNPSVKLFKTLDESAEWAKLMNTACIGELNDRIVAGGAGDLILIQEALQDAKIAQIANDIASGDKRFVMIAGPSSSGKTTFSHRLSTQLFAHGLKPHPIGLDDFYIDRDKCPRDENGKLDFECLESLDLELVDETLSSLLEGRETLMPKFNFLTGSRAERGWNLTLGPDDVLVIEGIHGLNDRLTKVIPAKDKYKIYISALTQLNIDEHNVISTADGRLIRRIIRDARTRGTCAKETIAMWKSVRRGEQKHIFPFQDSADVMFNSALVYELSVLKTYIEPLLYQITPADEEFVEANRLLKFLDYFLAIPSESIPPTSIIREFIGGSAFPV